ncbi:MAG: hypothetical protein PHW74_03550 [Desulfobacca sp.]|nr:hypothetical protein [Desulfobacca sp.]
MQALSKELKDKIIKALEARQAKLPCPRCGHQSFIILDGFFNPTLQTEGEVQVRAGPSVPTVVVICKQCGFISQHALGVLGLLGQEEIPSPGQKIPS